MNFQRLNFFKIHRCEALDERLAFEERRGGILNGMFFDDRRNYPKGTCWGFDGMKKLGS